jgi:membrane protein implicated in regulation of membrane protease activity
VARNPLLVARNSPLVVLVLLVLLIVGPLALVFWFPLAVFLLAVGGGYLLVRWYLRRRLERGPRERQA